MWDIYPIVSYQVVPANLPTCLPWENSREAPLYNYTPFSPHIRISKPWPTQSQEIVNSLYFQDQLKLFTVRYSSIVFSSAMSLMSIVLVFRTTDNGAMVGLTWSTGVTWLFSGSEESLATNIFPVVITGELVISVVKYFQMLRIIHCLGGRAGLSLSSDGDKLTRMLFEATQDLSRAALHHSQGLQVVAGSGGSSRHWRMWGKIFAYLGKVWNPSYQARRAQLTDKILHGLPSSSFARSPIPHLKTLPSCEGLSGPLHLSQLLIIGL